MAVIKRSDRYSPIKKQAVFYQDLSSAFKIHPNTLDVVVDTNTDAVSTSIRNILLTMKGERFFNPYFGSNLKNYLFENFDGITKNGMRTAIEDAITNYEPRANIENIKMDYLYDDSAVQISITFTTINNTTPTTVDMLLHRVR